MKQIYDFFRPVFRSIVPLSIGLLMQSTIVRADNVKFENRCGWFENPTPSNFDFYDRDARWVIGEQGGYQTKTDWPWPEFAKGQWLELNGHYGFGCTCIKMRANHKNHQVIQIKSFATRPLTTCQQDQALRKKWKRWYDASFTKPLSDEVEGDQ